MLVEVTQEHINQGVAYSLRRSPIALAIRENGLANVRVSNWYIFYNQQPTPLQFDFTTINNDSLIGKWIFDFDHGKGVFPIQIEIDEEALYATLVE